jgi:type II secretory pathway pseudopilin PulG
MKSKQATSKRSIAGFTLVEAAVALTICAIMLTSLFGAFASGFATVRSNRENLRATQIMISRLEGIRLCTFAQLTNTVYNPGTFTESFDPKDDATHAGGVVYNGTYTSTVPAPGSLPESYRTNVLLVTVNLNWTSGKLLHSRSMQTFAARDGIAGYVSVGR